jgi:hypothetical protein
MSPPSSQAALERWREARKRRRLLEELKLAEHVVGHIERKKRDAIQRVDGLSRLQKAMTEGERVALREVLQKKQRSLLRDLQQLQSAADFTTSFLTLRNSELQRLLAVNHPEGFRRAAGAGKSNERRTHGRTRTTA